MLYGLVEPYLVPLGILFAPALLIFIMLNKNTFVRNFILVLLFAIGASYVFWLVSSHLIQAVQLTNY